MSLCSLLIELHKQNIFISEFYIHFELDFLIAISHYTINFVLATIRPTSSRHTQSYISLRTKSFDKRLTFFYFGITMISKVKRK